MNRLTIVILFCLLSLTAFSQFRFNDIGAYAGLGHIEGDSPSIPSYSAKVFFDISTWLDYDVNFRFAFYYAQKLEGLLPDKDEEKYYAFQKGFSLQAVIEQHLNKSIYFEEGAGIVTINDRFFRGTNVWTYGTIFSALAGLDFRDMLYQGFRLGLGIESGLAFTKTAPSFNSVHIQTQYFF